MKNYISSIQKLEFHLPHLSILETHHCGKDRNEAFKRLGNLYYDLCRRDYADRVVSSFLIKSNQNIMAAIGLYLLNESS